jgi:hypothetical protein
MPAAAQTLPQRAHEYAPMVCAEVRAGLPGVSPCAEFGGQVEQETCPSLASTKCWSPRAELKTPREYGFGLGQLTIAYDAKGAVRFSAFDDVRRITPALRGWDFKDRYDPAMQIKALVSMDRACLLGFASGAATPADAHAMMFACYNGGAGGLRSDRLVCRNTRGCDPSRWWGNVESTSNKSRARWQGYGKSAFEINRDYPRNIMRVRAPHYIVLMGE